MINYDLEITEKKYGDKVILKNQNYSFDFGSITCFTGKSGCGKTTLLKILNHDITDFNGTLSLDKKEVGYVGQDSIFIEKFTAFDNIIIGLKNPNIDEINRCAKLLNVHECLNQKCQNLSGGQRQRISILRCITRENKYILLDEPTSSLDAQNIHYLLNLLREVAQENHISFIIATHEVFVVDFCDIVYEYDTLGFKIVKKEEFKKQTEKSVNNELYSLKKLLPKYYCTYLLKHLVFVFTYFLIIILFIWGLSSLVGLLQTDYDMYYDSLQEDLIFIQKKTQETTCDSNYKCQNNYYFEDITFTQQEIEKIENNMYVEEVYLAETLETTKFDNAGNELNNLMIDDNFFNELQLEYLVDIRQNILSTTQDYQEVTTDNTINYHFTSINVAIEYIESLGYYTELYPLTDIMYGTNDLTDNNDIVIPYSLALYISSVSDVEPQDLINQEIILPVTSSDGKVDDVKYEIIGIYEETNCATNQCLGNVYVKNDSNLTVENALLESNTKYGNNEKYMQVYPNDEEFYRVNDTGVTTIIIKSSNIEQLEEQVVNSDDIVVSKNIYKDKYFRSEKLLSSIFLAMMLLILIVLLIIIKRIIHSLYLKNVSNDIKVWKNMQYENNEINKFYKNIDFLNLILPIILICTLILLHIF